MTQVHQCIDRCHAPLAQAQGLVTAELEKFQVKIWLLLAITKTPVLVQQQTLTPLSTFSLHHVQIYFVSSCLNALVSLLSSGSSYQMYNALQ